MFFGTQWTKWMDGWMGTDGWVVDKNEWLCISILLPTSPIPLNSSNASSDPVQVVSSQDNSCCDVKGTEGKEEKVVMGGRDLSSFPPIQT